MDFRLDGQGLTHCGGRETEYWRLINSIQFHLFGSELFIATRTGLETVQGIIQAQTINKNYITTVVGHNVNQRVLGLQIKYFTSAPM